MGYTIEKKITKVNKGVAGANKPEWIIFHFVGASGQAQANANYFYSVYREASAHYFVDPNKIIQVVPDNTPAWHIGDGKRTRRGTNNGYIGHGATNNNAIGVELCQDTSTGSNVWSWDFHPETVNKALWLIKKLQRKYNIPDSRVIRHYDATAKKCPGNWAHNNWAKWWAFKKRLAGVSGGEVTGNPGKTDGKPSTNTKQHLVKAGETLSGIAKKYGKTVDQLVSWNNLDDANLIFPESYLVVEKPTTSKPASNNAKLVKNEDAYFLATTNIKVRNAPSTKATHTGTLKKGDSIHYYKVYEGNGYRWLQYVGNSGNKLYLPYRESGSGKEQWGTFHSSRPKGTTTAPATKKIAEDGWFGKDTATLAQQVYGMKHVDGVISGQPNNASTKNIPSAKFGSSGSNLIKAMQKEFGVPAKYRDGKITVPSKLMEAMQKYYGTPVDKKVSGPSMVIKEWQKNLNKGKRK